MVWKVVIILGEQGNKQVVSIEGAKEAMAPLKCLEHIVILCFQRRFSEQNSVIRLKWNILPPQNFRASYATGCEVMQNLWHCGEICAKAIYNAGGYGCVHSCSVSHLLQSLAISAQTILALS